MTFQFCPNCGFRLIKREIGDEGMTPYCENCQKPFFELPAVCIITLVLNEYKEAALLKQDYVTKESYVLVAGHLKSGERAEDATIREVKEELGITVYGTRYVDSYYYSKKDMLMLAFITSVKKEDFQLSVEVDSAVWVPVKEAVGLLKDKSIAKQVVLDYLAKV